MSNDDSNAPGGEGGNATTASELNERARDDFGAATDMAKHDLEAIKNKAAEDVADLRERAAEEVGEATEKAKSFAGDQKALAAGQISGIASAIDKVAEELDGSEQQVVARYARDLSAGLSSLGKTIEERDVDDLMGMAQDFGRKQPVAFLGAAALAGFVASRFALASTHRRENKPAAKQGASNEGRPASTPGYGGQ